MKTQGTIPNLIGGVSQQPPAVRGANQFEDMVNLYPDPVEGLITRPPTEHVASLGIEIDDDAFTHIIDRGPDNQQLLVIDATNGVRVFDLSDGSEHTVTDNAANLYLDPTNINSWATDIHAITEADTTFILNRNVTVAKGATTSGTRDFEGIVYVRAGVYDEYYRVYLDGTEVYTKTSSTNGDDVDVENIAKQLTGETAHATYGGSGSVLTLNNTDFPGYTFTRQGSTIHISRATDFTLSKTDGQGEALGAAEHMVIAKDKIQNFDNLPQKNEPGFKIEIMGAPGNEYDNYWVEFKVGAGDNMGYYEESLEPGIEIELDADTMPLKLTPDSPGPGFTLDTVAWVNKAVGGSTTNPFPSFVGQEIQTMWFYRNRFGVTAGEDVILSENGNYFNFFRTTITDLLDGDPIDEPVPARDVSVIYNAAPIGKAGVLLSGEHSHYIVSQGSSGLLTPTSLRIDLVSHFESDKNVEPVQMGPFVYLADNGPDWARVNELLFDADQDVLDTQDVTQAVPRYIPSGVIHLTGSTRDNLLAANMNDSADLYMWNNLWNGQDRIQSAWHRWDAGSGQIILAEFVDSYIWLVRRIPGEASTIERVDVSSGSSFDRVDYRLCLDRYFTLAHSEASVVWDGVKSTVTLPYSLNGERLIIAYDDQATKVETAVAYDNNVTGNQVEVVGVNLAAETWHAGVPFEAELTLSEFYHRDREGRPVIDQTLKLKRFALAYVDTGSFQIEVTAEGQTFTYQFTGSVVGNTNPDVFELDRGTFTCGLGGDSEHVTIKIKTLDHWPAQFTHASWDGRVTKRR